MAQEALKPTLMVLKTCAPPTCAGVRLQVALISPGQNPCTAEPLCPRPLAPQHHAVPAAVRPHVLPPPAARKAKCKPPLTAVGAPILCDVLPVPVAPVPFDPQQ